MLRWLCGGSTGSGCVGAGDVAGVLSEKGVSEKVIDDGLDSVDEGGNELRVPDGEPSGVNIACRSVVAAVPEPGKWPEKHLPHRGDADPGHHDIRRRLRYA